MAEVSVFLSLGACLMLLYCLREHHLLECAQKVEEDQQLNIDMKEWDVTLTDGLEDATW